MTSRSLRLFLLALVVCAPVGSLAIADEQPPATAAPAPSQTAPVAPNKSPLVEDPAVDLDSATKTPERPESFGKQLVQLVVVLGLVLALVYLTLNFGLRKLMGVPRQMLGGRSGIVSVVERVALEQRVSLYVVKAGSEYLLLGRTDQALSMLHKLSPEDVAKLQSEKPQAPFSPFLQKLLARRGEPPPSA
jgi:flagellar protein FliO/FliZ